MDVFFTISIKHIDNYEFLWQATTVIDSNL